MSALPSIVSAGNLLRNVAVNYLPVTDWRRFISPTIVFGTANLADRETEQKVVDSVGSYGFQLNRILDALAVLIRENQDQWIPRTETDQIILYRLLDLAEKADEAAKRAKST